MKTKNILCLAIAFAIGLSTMSFGAATVPKLLPFQGRLTDQNGVAISNGTKVVQFKIFAIPSGGSPVWAGELHRTTVNGGLINVVLGTKTPLDGVDFSQPLYLEVTVDVSGPGGVPDNAITDADPPMLPRQLILPPLFAAQSITSHEAQLLNGFDWSVLFGTNSPATGKISGTRLLDGTVNSNQIAPNAVGSAQIAPGAIAAIQLATGAVSTPILQDGAVTQSKLDPNVMDQIACACTQYPMILSNLQSVITNLQALQATIQNPWLPTDLATVASGTDPDKWQYAALVNGQFLNVTIQSLIGLGYSLVMTENSIPGVKSSPGVGQVVSTPGFHLWVVQPNGTILAEADSLAADINGTIRFQIPSGVASQFYRRRR
jgi:hypothetical protein